MKLNEFIDQYGNCELNESFVRKVEEVIALHQQTVWDLQNGDGYYIIRYGQPQFDKWEGHSEERLGRDAGGAFLTEEEVKKEIERRKVETLLLKHGGRRWYDEENRDHNVAIFVSDSKMKFWVHTYNTQGTIFFDTEKQAKKAVKEIGEERIKKALFEVR